MEKAIDAIRDEMAGKAKDLNVQYVGEQLTKHIMAHPADAPKFYAEGKNIEGALKKLEAYAQKHMQKNGNTGLACIDPEEGMRIILEYYGIKVGEAKAAKPSMMVARTMGRTDLDLDALLEM